MNVVSDFVGGRVRVGWVAAVLFLVVGVVYFFPKFRLPMDSHYSMLVSESLYKHGSFRLDRHFVNLDREWLPGMRREGKLPYMLHRYEEHVYLLYPPGTPVLSVPLVMVANAAGVSATRADGGYDAEGEVGVERFVASAVGAGVVVMLFLLAQNFVGRGRALVLALVGAFATGLWSTVSRVAWSHGWAMLLLCGVLWLLVRAERGGKLHPMWLGSLLSWTYFTRPTFSMTVAAVGLFVLLRHRRSFVPFAAAAAVWMGLFVVYSLKTCGQVLPGYYQQGALLSLGNVLPSLSGILVSPSRGVLIYSPVLVAAFWLALRRGAWRGEKALALLAFGALGLHLVLLVLFPIWWAGHCYGARFSVDLIPWMALLAAIGWRGAMESGAKSWVARGLTVLAVVVGVVMQGVGVFRVGPWYWNAYPVSVDAKHERLWDWSDPPFLRRHPH